MAVKLLWDIIKDDWGVILAIALPVVFLIWFFACYSTKCDAKVYDGVVPMAEHVDAIRNFEYKGHRYIWVARYNRGGLVHDPDCTCWSLRREAPCDRTDCKSHISDSER